MNLKPFEIKSALDTKTATDFSGSRSGHFWDIHAFDGGASWVGKWFGESPWEKHSKGDEFLHVFEGEVQNITNERKRSVIVPQGNTFVVPKNHWHRQIAKHEVRILGATPGVTDHSDMEPVL